MSEVKVNKISPRSGTDVTLGDSGDTFTIPSGATITNNGTASGFGDNLEWQSSIVTGSTITVESNKGYWLDTTSNAITVTLPASAAVGDRIILTDYARNWNTNNVTINPNSLNFQGNSSPNPVYSTDGQSVDIVYSGATQGWIPNSDDDVTLKTPQAYTVDYLVIAGGGGGGAGTAGSGGGGGAGGYRNSYDSETSGGGGASESSLTFNPGTTYTITVGAGGTGGANADSSSQGGTASNGNDSSISGSDITTVTSAAGGGGGATTVGGSSSNLAASGGSGGGAGDTDYSTTGASGTANQGFAGGDSASGGNDLFQNGGGGGGAGGAGGDATSSQNGINGTGLNSSITGSSVSRGGGGAGGLGNSSAGPTQEDTTYGGGDSGNGTGINGGNGTANTGGGGGGRSGGGGTSAGGNGGSGVVILRMPTSGYSGTTTGSPTVTTDGTDTILTFTASGSYTG